MTRSLASVIAGRAVGSSVSVIVMGARKVWPAGPTVNAAPPETPPPGSRLGATTSIVIVVIDDSAPAGISTDDPSPAVTVPPAGPIMLETCEADFGLAWQPAQSTATRRANTRSAKVMRDARS